MTFICADVGPGGAAGGGGAECEHPAANAIPATANTISFRITDLAVISRSI